MPGATHLFEEPGTLEEVARLAATGSPRTCGRAAAVRTGTRSWSDDAGATEPTDAEDAGRRGPRAGPAAAVARPTSTRCWSASATPAYVLLGEASHGTHEYYTWRAEISRG